MCLAGQDELYRIQNDNPSAQVAQPVTGFIFYSLHTLANLNNRPILPPIKSFDKAMALRLSVLIFVFLEEAKCEFKNYRKKERSASETIPSFTASAQALTTSGFSRDLTFENV